MCVDCITVEWVRDVLFQIPYVNLPVHSYGLCLMFAFLGPYYVGEKECARINRDARGVPQEYIDSIRPDATKEQRNATIPREGTLVTGDGRHAFTRADPATALIIAIVGGIVGARLFGVLVDGSISLDALRQAPVDTVLLLLDFNLGMAYQGGVVLAALLMIAYVATADKSVLQWTDLCGTVLPLGHFVGKFGCFSSGDGCYGPPTDLPWGMHFPNGRVPTQGPVHPTPLYEMAFAGSAFLLLMATRKRLTGTGLQSVLSLASVGLQRFCLEPWRTHSDEPAVYGQWGFEVSHYRAMAAGQIAVALLLGALLVCLPGLFYRPVTVWKRERAAQASAKRRQ